MKKKTLDYKLIWFVVLIFALMCIIFGLYWSSLLFFVFSGSITGIFFGLNNYRIFNYPHTDEFYKDYITKEKYGFEKEPPPVNTVARINEMWVHLVCGITGSIALFFLTAGFNFQCLAKSIEQISFVDGVLFLVALLGYTGLLPRTMWFLANKGGLGDFLKLGQKPT